MNEQASNLDRLHDLVLPSTVPWWPLAPGWYGLFVLLVIFVAWRVWKTWQRWQANAYRREALRVLSTLNDAAAIAELLRRTALAIAPRSTIAGMTGNAWTDWLAAQCDEAMAPEVHQLLTAGVYGRPIADIELCGLRDYAARWIARHQLNAIAHQVTLKPRKE